MCFPWRTVSSKIRDYAGAPYYKPDCSNCSTDQYRLYLTASRKQLYIRKFIVWVPKLKSFKGSSGRWKEKWSWVGFEGTTSEISSMFDASQHRGWVSPKPKFWAFSIKKDFRLFFFENFFWRSCRSKKIIHIIVTAHEDRLKTVWTAADLVKNVQILQRIFFT